MFFAAYFGFFLLLFDDVLSETIIMQDSQEFSAQVYECSKFIGWKKYCEHRDFTIGSCRPWRLEACDEPYIHQQLSPCPYFECKVNCYIGWSRFPHA